MYGLGPCVPCPMACLVSYVPQHVLWRVLSRKACPMSHGMSYGPWLCAYGPAFSFPLLRVLEKALAVEQARREALQEVEKLHSEKLMALQKAAQVAEEERHLTLAEAEQAHRERQEACEALGMESAPHEDSPQLLRYYACRTNRDVLFSRPGKAPLGALRHPVQFFSHGVSFNHSSEHVKIGQGLFRTFMHWLHWLLHWL